MLSQAQRGYSVAAVWGYRFLVFLELRLGAPPWSSKGLYFNFATYFVIHDKGTSRRFGPSDCDDESSPNGENRTDRSHYFLVCASFQSLQDDQII